jgi:exodeoxyribonuclease VII small subunit
MSEQQQAGTSFSTRMAALERVVAELESGELSLEDALRAFETGISLVRVLDEQLNEAERRIEVLTRGADGTLRLRPIAEDDD